MRSTRSPSSIERLLGLGPRPVPPHVFQIGPRRLRYARFEGSEGALGLLEVREEPLPPECFHDGPLGGPARDLEPLRQALGRMLDGEPLGEASLVMPDRWLRLAFGEITELPKSRDAQAEALRFKLRQLVPFRVDELRVRGFEVEPLADQEEPKRLVIAFCVDALARQLESLFEEREATLGLVTSESLALASLLESGAADEPGDGLTVLVLQSEEAWTLLVHTAAGPVVFRHKPWDSALDPALRASSIVRELRLTRSFLEERLPGRAVSRAVVAADDAESWSAWIGEGLGVTAETLSGDALAAAGAPTVRLPAGWSWSDGGPLLGVALQEVA